MPKHPIIIINKEEVSYFNYLTQYFKYFTILIFINLDEIKIPAKIIEEFSETHGEIEVKIKNFNLMNKIIIDKRWFASAQALV